MSEDGPEGVCIFRAREEEEEVTVKLHKDIQIEMKKTISQRLKGETVRRKSKRSHAAEIRNKMETKT